MANYKAFSPTAWKAFMDKCAALFPFLKKEWIGTRADWDLLSATDKAHYDKVSFIDDTADGGAVVVDEVTAGNLNPVTSNAVAGYALAKSELVPGTSKAIMTNFEDQGYDAIDGTTVYANNAGRIQCRNGVRAVANPTTARQWPVTSSAAKDEFIALGGLQFYLDKTNDKLWVRFADSSDMSAWKEL